MENDQTHKELVLQGNMLAQTDQLIQVVAHYKEQLATIPAVPVILDLCDLGNIHSREIGIILGLFKECKASRRPFNIITTNDDTINLFKMLKLDKVISIQRSGNESQR